MTGPLDPGGLLRGVSGPEAVTTGPVALIVAPGCRRLVESLKIHLGRDQAATVAELERWVLAVEIVAAAERSRMAASGAAPGQVPPGGFGPSDDADAGPRDLTVAEVAERLRMSTRTVRRLCAEGHLVSHKPGRDRLIESRSVDDYLARRRTA